MFRVLFICTGKSGRSLIAKAFAEKCATKSINLIAAGDKLNRVNSEVIKIMNEINIPIPEKLENSFEELKAEPFDIVITLCNKALESCPIFPGSPARIHWAIIDPESIKNKTDRINAYKKMRDDIRFRIESLCKFGFLDTIKELRLIFRSILNNLTDGVIAHDMERKIFFINDAALKITGYKREEVIGQDCHDVFPGKFCGGDCSFCEDKKEISSKLRYTRIFTKRSGETINLEMSVDTLKPPDNKILGALVVFRDVSEVFHLRKRLEETRGFNGIIGQHISMRKVFESIKELADVKVPILIQGETGTGKELVALALHQQSRKSYGPFVPVNCGALPEGTLESELFGHVKGAFTGAISNRKGRFELAEGGTIFLDEIGEISQSMQVKLLRVLQENCFIPVGGEKIIKSNVRIIAATNKDLKKLTDQGLFREDLFYRLSVVPINLPSLKERRSDIKLLIEHFLDKFSNEIGKKVRYISDSALSLMEKYNWPGNVRELSNAVQYSMIKCKENDFCIEVKHLPPEINEDIYQNSHSKLGRPFEISIDTVKDALIKTAGNKQKAAKLLGISRTSIYRIIRENM